MEKDSMASKIPMILCHESAWPAFSVFNPNDWSSGSKAIIHSCAANYGLLVYGVAKIESIFAAAETLCQPRVEDLVAQWKVSRWDVSACRVMGRDVLHLFHLKNSGKIYIGEDKGPALEFRILADEFSAFRHHKKPVHTICRNSFGKFIK